MGGSIRRGCFLLDERWLFASFVKAVGNVFSLLHASFSSVKKKKERSLKSFSRKYQLRNFSVMKNLDFTFQEKIKYCYLFMYFLHY